MLSRTFRLLLLLSLCFGIPYVWFSDVLTDARFKLADWYGGQQDGSRFALLDLTASNGVSGDGDAASDLAGEDGDATPARLSGGATQELDEVLRFDVSPAWVTSRWPRVSTVLADQQLQGLRVPLVTGTQPEDLAGSLTYYFDHRRVLRRVTFDGHTGDTGKLIALVTRRFGMRPTPDLGAGLYLVRWNGEPTSALRISHAAVVRADNPLSKFQVQLEINRPDLGYELSPRFQEILQQDRAVRRW